MNSCESQRPWKVTSPVDFADRRLKLLSRNFQHVEMNSFCLYSLSLLIDHLKYVIFFCLLFFWDYWIICHTLKVFMSRQLNDIRRRNFVVCIVWIIVLLPLWFFTLGSNPAFSAIVFIRELSLCKPTADLFEPWFIRILVFAGVYCQVKWRLVVLHFWWPFLRGV